MTTFLTTVDLAARTGKTPEFWARLCKAKKLPAIKLGNEWQVAEDAFEEFMRGGGTVTARKRLSARQQRKAS